MRASTAASEPPPGTSDHSVTENEASCTGKTSEISKRKHQRIKRRLILLTVMAAGMVSFITGAVVRDSSPEELDLFTVKASTFRDVYETKGNISPLRTERVASDCRWSTRILSIVPEGTWVQKGDVVCELDSSEVEEYLREREVRLIRARAGLETSVQDELIEKTNTERRRSKAEFNLDVAGLELEEYFGGTWPEEQARLERDMQLVEDQLLAAEDNFEFNEYLWISGHANSGARNRASLDLHDRELQMRALESERHLLTDFQHPRTELQLKHKRNNAQREVLRTQIATSLAETRARLATLSDERRVSIYERYVAFAKRSFEACTLRAPRSGQVIYATSWYDRSRGRNAIEVGRSVRFRQGIFEIPDSDRFKVRVPLAEALITKAYRGMSADVQLTGYPDEVIAGEVTHISRYPKTRSRYTPGVREYWLDVTLDPTEAQLDLIRTNAEAMVSLVLQEQSDVLMIPRAAVAGISGNNFVWRMEGSDLVVQPVMLGDIQDDRVIVEEGLQPGDAVAVNLPPQQREALSKLLQPE
jgi:HlyD family secretion protein